MRIPFLSVLVLCAVVSAPMADVEYVSSHAGVGPLAFYPLYFGTPELGLDAYVTLRPDAAKFFYPGFEKSNTGMAFEVLYLEMSGMRRILDIDVTFRRYLARMEPRPEEDSMFLGAGVGILAIAWDSEDVGYRNASFLGEVGYEYRSARNLMLTFKMQARYMKAGPVNLNGIAMVVSAGWRAN